MRYKKTYDFEVTLVFDEVIAAYTKKEALKKLKAKFKEQFNISDLDCSATFWLRTSVR